MLLRPPIAAPTHIARLSALGLAFAAAGLFALAKPALEAPRQKGTPTIMMHEQAAIDLDVPFAAQTEAPPIAKTSSRSLSMVFSAQNATWMKLENLRVFDGTTDMDGVQRMAAPKHGRAKLTRENYMEISIASVANADVPVVYRDRLGTQVTVDGTCNATITGFAIVARLSGSPGYAGDDTSDTWTAKNVMEYGAPMLAAKLGGCTGTLARDASLPAPVSPRTLKDDDAKVVAAAKRLLLKSKIARDTQTEWAEHYKDDSNWATHEATEWKTEMFIHPTTHATWVSIHGSQIEGCGSPHVNVWGLYRVEADGKLTSFGADLRDIVKIEDLVDLDNDGIVEVLGSPWLGGRLVNDVKGNTLEKLDEPFYGCPC